MSLSSNQLDAFTEVARTSHFSKAAKNLAVTQSALSQRIKNLEEELETVLFVREPAGVRLTLAGEELLRYCKCRQELESECLLRLKDPTTSALAGVVRVGGFSTVVRSVLLPSLQPLLVKNPKIRAELTLREMRDLPKLLFMGETDYVFLDHEIEKEGVESHLIGYEENVLIEPSSGKVNEGVFLDHDFEDETTIRFFKRQNNPPPQITRMFLDEIYGIIDGVEWGLGRAVVPKHLIHSHQGVRIVHGFKSLRIPVYMNYYRQPFYTRLQKIVISHLMTETKAKLAG